MDKVLSYSNVSYSYEQAGCRIQVLDNLTVQIEDADFVMITGPSGSGKSTFLHLGSLLDRPTSGEIYFGDVNVSVLSDDALSRMRASAVGIIFQSYQLLLRHSVLENIRFSFRYLDIDRSSVEERALHALDRVGLTHMADKPARLLSGGEMQRVAIARAIASEPQILFADEPTGNLDSKTSTTIMQTLASLNSQGLTIIMVTHDERLLSYASKWYFLDHGQLTRQKIPEDNACTRNA